MTCVGGGGIHVRMVIYTGHGNEHLRADMWVPKCRGRALWRGKAVGTGGSTWRRGSTENECTCECVDVGQ